MYGPNLVKLTRLNHRYVWDFFKLKYGRPTAKPCLAVPLSKVVRQLPCLPYRRRPPCSFSLDFGTIEIIYVPSLAATRRTGVESSWSCCCADSSGSARPLLFMHNLRSIHISFIINTSISYGYSCYNKEVSYFKQIDRASALVVEPAKMFFISSFVTMQNMPTVSRTGCAHVGGP